MAPGTSARMDGASQATLGRQNAARQTPRPRQDAPHVNPSRRGDRATAWAKTSSEQARAEAVAALQLDVCAVSSAAPRDSLAWTWLALHSSWFGPRIEALRPKLQGVMAALMAGGYRSAANYASRAKALHILAGHPWSDELALSTQHTVASTKRGIGPARQFAPLPLGDVARWDWGDQAMAPGGPCAVGCLVVAGAFFCREIGTSLAGGSMSPSTRRRRRPLGFYRRRSATRRRWASRGLGDVSAPGLRAPCPYCALAEQVAWLDVTFGKHTGADDVPLFPTATGGTAATVTVVESFEAVASRMGRPTLAEDGVLLFGGHKLRVTGARWLTRLGMPIPTIQLMAVLRGVGDEPLERVTEAYRAAFAARDAVPSAVGGQAERVVMAAPPASGGDVAGAVGDPQIELGTAEPTLVWRKGGFTCAKVHRIATRHLRSVPSLAWTTRCGWTFGFAKFEWGLSAPASLEPCKSCSARPGRPAPGDEAD